MFLAKFDAAGNHLYSHNYGDLTQLANWTGIDRIAVDSADNIASQGRQMGNSTTAQLNSACAKIAGKSRRVRA